MNDASMAAAPSETIQYDELTLAFTGSLATLTLNDPDRLNAISPAMALAMTEALVELSKPRRAVRCVLITGNGRSFCAGANLAGEAKAVSAGQAKRSALSTLETAYHPALRRLRDLPIPVVAAINGPCVGIGIGILLAADHAIASENAFFLLPFRNLASAPDSGVTWSLPRVIGVQRARRMILRAERVTAATALEWGLISEVVSPGEFVAHAQAVAEDFASGPTIALCEMKRLIADGAVVGPDAAMESEARAVARTSRTKDNVAAMRVFGKNEKPSFTGE